MKTLFIALLLGGLAFPQPAFAEISCGSRYEPSTSRYSKRSTPPIGALRVNSYSRHSLSNPYGAGSRYKSNGLMNPYSQYGSSYSNRSWRNTRATNAPQIYDSNGRYHGRLSTNRYDRDSTSNPYGRYGSPYSRDSINNQYGAGNPYSSTPLYIYPGR
jgi:hypothetical protein